VDHAIKRLKNHRGGPELYTTIRRDVDEESLLTYVVTSGALWTISDEKRVLDSPWFATRSSKASSFTTSSVANESRRHCCGSSGGGERTEDGLALPGIEV